MQKMWSLEDHLSYPMMTDLHSTLINLVKTCDNNMVNPVLCRIMRVGLIEKDKAFYHE